MREELSDAPVEIRDLKWHTATQPGDIVESLRAGFRTSQALQQIGDSIEQDDGGMPRDPQSSIQRHQVLCLECGKAFKLLNNHHLALHGLTPRAYKHKHGIRMTQALSARTLSARRSKLAKELGRGKKPEPPLFPPACAARMPKLIPQEEVIQLIGRKAA